MTKLKNYRKFGGKEYLIYQQTLTKSKALDIKEKISDWANVRITESKTYFRIWYRRKK